jgi:sugar phosphate isomerase/epimerase
MPLLILSTCTLLGAPFRERVEAAAATGFDGIGLNLRDYTHARGAEGLDDDSMRKLLESNGLKVMEIEFVSGWSHGGPVGEAADRKIADLLQMCATFRCEQLNIGGDTEGALAHVAASFASVCDRAAPYGVTVALEPMPYTNIPDVAAATRIVIEADRPNRGVLVDSWHVHRGAGLQSLRTIDPSVVVGIQINDAAAEAESEMEDEGEHRRLLPGEGAIDLVGFLHALWGHGINTPIGVEVISDELQRKRPLDAAKLVGESSRRVLSRAIDAG